ncbi:flagellar basal-body rod protein FlgF [Steroidobacter agaridevorans]|uniref:Flagellar basal-body rod protein FlgF n=1 Tax=Steroidobacter agaridevorans TaxID=2695856 RepID=A0A829YN57_9GAMM|nr:flagellar basal-body rod protein FlgF [Steroidobacter agaridevorans]GFE84785.1 flagellar basal-body rod protein FlgF [Steroidobacter agaridevorans]GFE86318.1 flagellar basal-body rod protein FlgF [Steroidobacter agaridevorans]
MDRFLYISMSGAKETLRAQTANNHNLANASTTGFRADMSAFQTRNVAGSGYASRAYATNSTTGWDPTQGALTATGRDLDVGVNGAGWIAVLGKDGREAYTRAGDLRVDPTGMLMTGAGLQVMGEGGPISVPPNTSATIGSDGTISVIPLGQGAETTAMIGRIKLVNPPDADMVRGEDGLFRSATGADLPADANVKLVTGSLEASNVNTADAMVNMIELARRFDLQVKAMRTAEENAATAAQLLRGGV